LKTDVCELLQLWCDSLLQHQLHGTGHKTLDGALLCPACQTIHGRCGELVYPLLALADHLNEPRYLDAARRLFDWSESLFCSDGCMVNDGQSMWNGITAFAAIALCDALRWHGRLLSSEEKSRWEQRLRAHGDWILRHIDENFDSNINYNAAAAGSMALLGNYFDCGAYRTHARRMAAYVMCHATADGLFYGEGKPIDSQSPKGCRPVDIGYNVEESLPLMQLYAEQSGDEAAQNWVEDLLSSHLVFMLPDGGWDNSFGTRNYKWTYWGSRTSEGCLDAYARLGRKDARCAAAAARNFAQMRRCTVRGLLAGGPDYGKAGVQPCIHHAFSHARGLAVLLDEDLPLRDAAPLPCESAPPLTYYPTIDTYRIHLGGWYADITGYDFEYMPGGHASGGTLSLLWHRDHGLMAASAMTQYRLYEAHNMQQLTDLDLQGSLTPRIEQDGFASCHDYSAVLRAGQTPDSVCVEASGSLRRPDQTVLPGAGAYRLHYRFTEKTLTLTVTAPPRAEFILPLSGGSVSPAAPVTRPVFSPAGGLLAAEHRWPIPADGRLCLTVRP